VEGFSTISSISIALAADATFVWWQKFMWGAVLCSLGSLWLSPFHLLFYGFFFLLCASLCFPLNFSLCFLLLVVSQYHGWVFLLLLDLQLKCSSQVSGCIDLYLL
jgi:hypothetical protein